MGNVGRAEHCGGIECLFHGVEKSIVVCNFEMWPYTVAMKFE